MSLNRVTLIGRLVRDPEVRHTSSGKSVVEFSLAVDKRIKPQDPNLPGADFFRCKAWNHQADFLASYGAKGRLAAIEGRLESRRYVDKEGNNRDVIEVVCDNVQLLDRPRDEFAAEPVSTSAAPAREQTPRRNASRATPRKAEEFFDPFAA